MQPHTPTEALLKAIETLGHPVIRTRFWNLWELGAEMLRWEFAIAVAGKVLGIDPFDEPDVQASKDRTARLLAHYQQTGELVRPPAAFSEGSLSVGGTEASDLRSALTDLIGRIPPAGYLGLLAFIDPTPDTLELLHAIRQLLAERLRIPTILGIGPRYLHSTGQLFKGGPNTGAFIQLVSEPANDLPVPGQRYSFRTMFLAQAYGDYEALVSRGRPVLQISFRRDALEALEQLEQALVVTVH